MSVVSRFILFLNLHLYYYRIKEEIKKASTKLHEQCMLLHTKLNQRWSKKQDELINQTGQTTYNVR